MTLKAPFPFFGGKSKCAHLVWAALGDVEHYVEPFAGSLAVLLLRPHPPRVETVNDKDGFIANFWRALKYAPEEVAYWANDPVNEVDLTARHIWLVNTGSERVARLEGDPFYYDTQVAGWWVWGISCWIGGYWCTGNGKWGSIDGKLVDLRQIQTDGDVKPNGVSIRRPYLGIGDGINRKGVTSKRPHIGRGQGIHQSSFNSNTGSEDEGTNAGLSNLIPYFNQLAERLRRVRVCCGDWSRVVTKGALCHFSLTGIFLDPPYSHDFRDDTIYGAHESDTIYLDVQKWCLENGDNPGYRIVLAGYEGEHNILEEHGWRKVVWKANRSYGTSRNKNSQNNENRHKERLWLSPHCLYQEQFDIE